jgi:glutamyl-tRNA reductase
MQGVVRARRHRLMLLVDIAVPRDIDPRVGDLENVFLYDVDQLESVSRGAADARRREAEAAERIVHEEVAEFEVWRRSLALTPTIVALRARVRDIVVGELARTVPRLEGLSDDHKKSLDRMADAIVNKLLHQPLTELKKGAEHDEGAQLLDAAQRLFALQIDASAARRASAADEAMPASPAVAEVKR